MKKKNDKRTLIILLSVILTGILGFVVVYFTALRVGYCFDTAFDETGKRLYVTAGYRGLHIFNMTKEGNLKYVTTYYTDGYFRYMEIASGRAYIANNEKGLEVLDIQHEMPRTIWSQSDSKGYGLHITDNMIYLASNEYGLQIFGISDPDRPTLLSNYPTTGRVWDVWVNDGAAFLADRELGMIIVDVSTPSQPHQIGFLTWGDDPMAEVIDGAGDYVYIAAGVNGLVVVNISDPTQPRITCQYDPGPDTYGEGVVVKEGILYLTMNDALSPAYNGLHIFDLADPSQPLLLSRSPISDGVEDISLSGSQLAVANTYSGIVLYDIQSLTNPTLVDMYPGRFWRSFTKLMGR